MTKNYQQLINQTPPSGVLKLDPPRDEVQGPLVIRQPLTLVGQGGTLWCEKGPVLIVQSSGVVLRDLNVEVTGMQSDGSDAEACALSVEPGLGITLDAVVVRGTVLGLRGEEGVWRYPRTLRLPPLAADTRHTFTLRLLVPVPCQLASEIDGVKVMPHQLSPGRAEICLAVDPLKENIRLRGFLTLRSSLLLRRIHLTCNIQRTGGTTGQGEVVFAPADWDTLVDAGVPAPSEPDPLSLPTIDNLDLDLPSPLAPTTSPQPTPAGPTLTIDPSPAPASPVPAPGCTPSRTPLPDPVIPDLTLDSTPVVSPTPTATPPPTATPAPTPAPPTKLPLNPGVEKQVRRHSRRDVNLPGVFTESAAEETPATPEETAETSTETSDSTPLSPVTESSDSPAKKTSKRAKRGPISSLFLESEPPTESEDPPAQ